MTPLPSSASEELRAAIEAAGGAIPFERFMAVALYGEHGFYTRPDAGRAGRRGDFITSPEVGPLFGTVLAAMLDAEWERLGTGINDGVVFAAAHGLGHRQRGEFGIVPVDVGHTGEFGTFGASG